jgi:hypothetical protein
LVLVFACGTWIRERIEGEDSDSDSFRIARFAAFGWRTTACPFVKGFERAFAEVGAFVLVIHGCGIDLSTLLSEISAYADELVKVATTISLSLT